MPKLYHQLMKTTIGVPKNSCAVIFELFSYPFNSTIITISILTLGK